MTKIVGYTYKAENYRPGDLVEVMIGERTLSPAARDMDVEEALDQAAGANAIDRNDEFSYDIGDFPKVIFSSQISDDDADWYDEQ